MLEAIRKRLAGYELLLLLLPFGIIVALVWWVASTFFGIDLSSLFKQNPYFWYSVLFGVLTGSAEVIARYRDEPFLALFSPPGQWYLILNGAISGAHTAFYRGTSTRSSRA